VAAGFMVRLFLIQHDCRHGSFFRHHLANAWLGRVLGVLTLTPHDWWRRTQAVHNAYSVNLDRRGVGDIDTLTVGEYRALPLWKRLRYRLYRHPLVMFGVGPAYLFFLQHRLPVGLMRDGWRPWLSAMATNLAIALSAAGLICLIGIKAFLLVHLPIMLFAASAGVWLGTPFTGLAVVIWVPVSMNDLPAVFAGGLPPAAILATELTPSCAILPGYCTESAAKTPLLTRPMPWQLPSMVTTKACFCLPAAFSAA
jgi:fatty acid desaturase